jgi:DNA polymerase I-like protein with 3'-5' exonuclease and polymerase domains
MSEPTLSHDYITTPYYVIDLETSVKNKGEAAVGSMQASPFHPDNKIVLSGIHSKAGTSITVERVPLIPTIPATKVVMVGHNIKFDLLYLMREFPEGVQKALLDNVMLWDTMVVEYLISGMQFKFASLDDLSAKYGGTIKDDRIKKYWEDGVDTEDIPIAELRQYLKNDLRNTEIVFLCQKVIAAGMPKMLDLIELEMQSLADTVIAEYNGMYVDMDILAEDAIKLSEKLQEFEEYFKIVNPNLNWSSPAQLSAFLFGGTVKIGEKEERVLDSYGNPYYYKTGKKAGKPRVHKINWIETYPGYIKSESFVHSLVPDTSTDEKNLKHIIELITGMGLTWSHNYLSQIGLLSKILDYRTLYKDFHTYYTGIAKAVWPRDSCVHATFNHTATDTGRLSCSSPNLQNITSAE